MKIEIELGREVPHRNLALHFAAEELQNAWLSVAFPEGRNRTDRYLRRHPSASAGAKRIDPNRPVRVKDEPPKLTIPQHLERLRGARLLSEPVPSVSDQGEFLLEPYRVVITASDLVANLLRPAFHHEGLGGPRVFHLLDEPIDRQTYLCLVFRRTAAGARLELNRLRFDLAADTVRDASGTDQIAAGLEWAAAVVPLVEGGRALAATEIAQHDYDLRQILGRLAPEAMIPAYEGWFDQWHERVAAAVVQHEAQRRPFEVFYHNVVAVDAAGAVSVWQLDASLPDLACRLADEGAVAAGILDSGGSCAVYDAWLDAYVNHGWYFREPRGAVITLEYAFPQRLPHPLAGSWADRRGS